MFFNATNWGCIISHIVYNGNMIIEKHIQDKRNELIWALNNQDYTDSQVGRVFNLNRSTISRIIKIKPKDWKVKWVKIEK